MSKGFGNINNLMLDNRIDRIEAGYGTTANRPVAPKINISYFDTDLNKAIWYNGTEWVDANGTAI